MKIALVTTTINVPRVLALYRKHGPPTNDLQYFIVGDIKTPSLTTEIFGQNYFSPEYQKTLGYKCSELIGWNCIQRRNIGFLEALKWGADAIVSIDDDNLAPSHVYFHDAIEPFLGVHNGIAATSAFGWFDVGTLLQPQAEHRGFPHTKRSAPVFDSVVDARIGVAAGICLGDPDIGAVTRIANGPTVHGVSELLRSGIVTNPKTTWTVFNSQNTAIIRELIPAWFMFPGCGRFDDIYASLIVQRVMREKGLYVHFGRPFVWQQRNQHDLIKDLRAEIDGMDNIVKLAEHLANVVSFGEKSVITFLRDLFYTLPDFLPEQSLQAAFAWLDDCEQVMK